ncbi:PASTA domain-containing protein [Klenkia terrae]|uniref:PASTA domain-containing protein n=1 Tax=Klenkia terrae TaxID=1052259 RepID=UPI0036194663
MPPELDAILLKAMSKNPANRYQSAAEMRSDLLRAVAGQRVEATPVMGDAERTSYIGAGGYPGHDDQWDADDEAAAQRRKRGIIALVVAGVLVLGGLIALLVALYSGGGGSDTPAAPTTATVQVPNLVNQPQAAAEAALTQQGLELGTVSTEASTTVAEGSVISTDPAAGQSVDEGTAVNLLVSAGPDTETIPNVVGLAEAAARANLENAGFTRINTSQVPSTEAAGTVVSVSPAEGSEANPETQVITLSLSSGSAPIPDVRGQTYDQARATLQAAGFTDITQQNAESNDVPAGQAIGTEPGTNTQATADDQITVLIAVPIPTETTTTSVPTTTAPSTGTGIPIPTLPSN